jgi:hypothetical protein
VYSFDAARAAGGLIVNTAPLTATVPPEASIVKVVPSPLGVRTMLPVSALLEGLDEGGTIFALRAIPVFIVGAPVPEPEPKPDPDPDSDPELEPTAAE